MKRLFAILVLTLILSGCATQGQGYRMIDEHVEQVGSGELHLVTSGDGYTSPELAQNYILYRCAELAQSHNKPFFIMYDTLVDAARERPTSTPLNGLVLGKPIGSTFVLLLDARRPSAKRTSAVLEELKKTVAAGKLEQPANAQNK
jgi:hypothetical protein